MAMWGEGWGRRGGIKARIEESMEISKEGKGRMRERHKKEKKGGKKRRVRDEKASTREIDKKEYEYKDGKKGKETNKHGGREKRKRG